MAQFSYLDKTVSLLQLYGDGSFLTTDHSTDETAIGATNKATYINSYGPADSSAVSSTHCSTDFTAYYAALRTAHSPAVFATN